MIHSPWVMLPAAVLLVLVLATCPTSAYALSDADMPIDAPFEVDPGMTVPQDPAEPDPVPEDPAPDPVPDPGVTPTAPGIVETMPPLETASLESLMPGEEVPPEPPQDMTQVVELLTSINTYLTYLFVFGGFYVLVTMGGLVYRLLKIFF